MRDLFKQSPTFKWLWISTVIIVLDQITKQLVEQQLHLHQTIPVVPMFNITLAYNEGAAFSFLSDAGGWQRWFFIVLTLVISTVLLFWLKRTDPNNKTEAISLSLILGGAIGNLIDRTLFGHVIDFIQVFYQTYYWPAFNVADSAISCGVVLLIISSLRSQPEQQHN